MLSLSEMIYPGNFEQKIGFDKIRDLISGKCLSRLGADKTEKMSFSSDYIVIARQLHQTEEFVRILTEEDDFPSDAFYDVRPYLYKVRIEGAFLEEKELFDIRRSLQTIHDIVRFFEKKEDETAYPYLREIAGEVTVFPAILNRIDQLLDKFGRIKDNASQELSRIRKELNQTMQGISKSLLSILRSAQSEGFVDKDVTPTVRDGRLVIPVSPAYKRKIKGIVHDESATGKTVFIEPAEVVEANNKIRELEGEEKREIVRILTAFTEFIRPDIPVILQSYDFLALIDFIRAKALLALDIQAVMPVFEDKQQVDWAQAIHPLLFLSLRKQQKQIVPLDIELNEKDRILIISGPNAGGKSVCLKTVGLLQYMLQCGVPVPMHKSSRTGIFKEIFIDIGDEQSIENDLSTYSSHLTNMKYIVRNCTPGSLILIDEFGSGTEPQIGGAIAEALLKRFNERKSYGVITTHYQNLKHFAEENEGVVNGAMLYDRHQMQALFKLSIGNPGSSFAVEIARKIGLPEEVIADASEIVGSNYIDMDKYLQDIVRDKRYWENKRQSVRIQEKKLDEISARYEADLQQLEKQRKEVLAKAKVDAERILGDANARIENTIREIRESQAEKEKTRQARQSLHEFRTSIDNETPIDDKIGRKIQKLKEKENRKKKENTPVQDKKGVFRPEVIEEGDHVRLKGQTSTGTVLAVQGKNITVAFGMIKSVVKSEALEKVSKSQIKKESFAKSSFVSAQTSDDIREKKLNFRQDIDVRGMRGDEALQAVMYYVDDATLVGVPRVRILHGTGTGALRQIIRDYLKTVPQVVGFHDEHVQFGGTGITVVELE